MDIPGNLDYCEHDKRRARCKLCPRGGNLVPAEERGEASTSHEKKSKRRRGRKNKAARTEQEEGFRSPGATGG